MAIITGLVQYTIGLMVDDYEMTDGTKFSWANTAQKSAPYQNRDPRFYATILYDGAGWKPRDKVSEMSILRTRFRLVI
ncbi:hypothetical protein CS542_05835 [Pedobacter sp. IW39]|nr:hypothetical protein CS542_05835 [Pedobacter sp. IW39]